MLTCLVGAPRDGSGILGGGVRRPRVASLRALGGPGAPAARSSVGPLLISARGRGADEVSGEGSPGRGADGSEPRGTPPAHSSGNLGRGWRGSEESQDEGAVVGSRLHPALQEVCCPKEHPRRRKRQRRRGIQERAGGGHKAETLKEIQEQERTHRDTLQRDRETVRGLAGERR